MLTIVNNIKYKNSFIIALIIFVLSTINISYFYYEAKLNVMAEITNYSKTIAKASAEFTDGDLIKNIKSTSDMQNYNIVVKNYHQLLSVVPDIAYIYAMVYENGKVHFVVDVQNPNLTSNGVSDSATIMEAYDDASDKLLEGFKTQKLAIEDEPYSDKWGTFMSVYAPIKDSNGMFVGMVGADIKADNYSQKFSIIHSALAICILGCILISLAVGYLALRLNYSVSDSLN